MQKNDLKYELLSRQICDIRKNDKKIVNFRQCFWCWFTLLQVIVERQKMILLLLESQDLEEHIYGNYSVVS
jgi:hypothetical protein